MWTVCCATRHPAQSHVCSPALSLSPPAACTGDLISKLYYHDGLLGNLTPTSDLICRQTVHWMQQHNMQLTELCTLTTWLLLSTLVHVSSLCPCICVCALEIRSVKQTFLSCPVDSCSKRYNVRGFICSDWSLQVWDGCF